MLPAPPPSPSPFPALVPPLKPPAIPPPLYPPPPPLLPPPPPTRRNLSRQDVPAELSTIIWVLSHLSFSVCRFLGHGIIIELRDSSLSFLSLHPCPVFFGLEGFQSFSSSSIFLTIRLATTTISTNVATAIRNIILLPVSLHQKP